MQMIPASRLASFVALRRDDPAVRAGWRAFDARVREAAGSGRALLEREHAARAEAHARRPGYTYPNFIRLMAREAAEMAFHHRVTGCAESAAAARLLLGWAMELPAWNAQGPRNGWRSDLWTADLAAAAAFALDGLGDTLEAATRAVWTARLLERGVQPLLDEWLDPARRLHALDTMGHNWWAVCVGGAALGLFAARAAPASAEPWFDRIADGLREFFAYPGNRQQHKQRTFGAQGDFIESAGYLDYSLHLLCPLFDLYRLHLGRDLPAEIPVLARIPDYYVALAQPLRSGLQRLNFGDMGSGPDTVGSYAHQPAATWLWLAGEFGREDLFHLARRTKPAPAERQEFLFWPDRLRGEGFAGAPGDTVFDSIGVAVLRDGYADDATVLAVKTGEIWNHNQSDAGSIILSSRGTEFLLDPGTTEYSNPLHQGWFKTAHAHNVTLCDGRGPRADLDELGTPFMGRLCDRLLAPGYKYLLADATGPWEGVYRRYLRHLLWADGFVLSVEDLMADRASEFTALLHHAGTAVVEGPSIRIRNGGATLTAHLVAPAFSAVEVRDGWRSRMRANPFKYEYDVTPSPYLAVRYPARTATDVREKIVTLYALPGGPERRVERIEAPDLTGVRISCADGTWEIICNHRADGRIMHLNAPVEWGGFRTDAFLLAVRRDGTGRVDRLGLHNGSFVHQQDRTIYSALLKGDALWTRGEDGAVTLHSHLSAPARADVAQGDGMPVRVRLPAGPAHVDVAGDAL